MKYFDKKDLTRLLEQQGDPSVSIYLPMARKSDKTLKNPIRYKNAVKEVEKQMDHAGYDVRDIRAVVTRLNESVEEYEFFQEQLDGLAVFLADEFLQLIKLPVRLEYQVEVQDTLDIRPLIQVMQNDIEFYIVVLSQKKARLLKASKFTIAEITLDSETPTSFEDAMRFDTPQDQLQYKMISGASGGSTAIYHGHTESDQEKKNLLRYLGMLDRGISRAIADHDLPIMLFGLDYLHPIYRDASALPNIAGFGIQKNADELTIDTIQGEAWEAVSKNMTLASKKAIREYKNLAGSKKFETNMKEIPLVAANGRVDTLFVDKQDHLFGIIDLESQSVDLHGSEKEQGAAELINFSVKHTLMNGGEVFVLDAEEMPVSESPAGAILRY